ncbi:putative high affinity immunoglobulin gamma Fc receptor IB [Channa argus]|uniref:putative high affinity immunoglobulin gamma Fc receptor IB n=1 Tax=Channa argus TaxID=215402 RepID=UPI003521D0AC
MEVTALCFRLLMLEVILLRAHVQTNCTQAMAFLRITPNKLQHFQFNSVSFDCVGFGGLTHLKGMKNAEEFSPTCDINRTPALLCTIYRAYPEDSGEYWCESDGERSQSVNITVTAGSVILEIPALPVIEGSNLTLRCSSKETPTNLTIFYKNDVPIQSSPAEEIRISNVSKSDEGLYKCNISRVGTSQGSWLAVRANTISDPSTPPHEGPLTEGPESLEVFILLSVAVTILSVILVLLVIGFLNIRKHRELVKEQIATPSSFNRVDGADESSGVTYAVVVTKQRKDKGLLEL